MQGRVARISNQVRSETMRAELLTAARALFVERGYGDTSTPDIVSAAGVTRGALYHHFTDKKALFAAVVELEAIAVHRAIAETKEASPRAALIAGGDAFLQAMQAPGRVRLLLLDGPAVLGRTAMDEIDARTGGATLRDGLAFAAAQGLVSPKLAIDAAAQLLSAAFDRAALAIADGADAPNYRAALAALIDGLLIEPRKTGGR